MVELRLRFPELELHIHDGTADRLEADLVEGRLDALIVPLPTGLPGCVEIAIASDSFVLVAPTRSKLGPPPEPIAPDTG